MSAAILALALFSGACWIAVAAAIAAKWRPCHTNDASHAVKHGSGVCKPDSTPAADGFAASLSIQTLSRHSAGAATLGAEPISTPTINGTASQPVSNPGTLPLQPSSSRLACPSTPLHALIIPILLALASSAGAQEPSAAFLPGDIREAIQELREVRKANQAVAAESREWRGLLDRTERRFDGKFLDRIGALIHMAFWLAIVAMVSVTVACAAYGLDKVAGVIKSFKELFRKST